MTKTTIFEEIGWSEHANDKIEIVDEFSPSNSFEGCIVRVNGRTIANDICTEDAIIKALGEEVGRWIIEHM